MSVTDPVRRARSSLARSYRGDVHVTPERQAELRRNLTEAKLERAINEAVAAAPPLTDEQRARLAQLLSGGAR